MALDKLVDSSQLDADLTSIANVIRTKSGTSKQLTFPAGFISAAQAIETGGEIADAELLRKEKEIQRLESTFNGNTL